MIVSIYPNKLNMNKYNVGYLSIEYLKSNNYTNQHGGSIDKMYKWIVPYAQGKKGWQFSKERVTQNQFHKALLKYNSININTVSFERNISFSYVDALTNRIY